MLTCATRMEPERDQDPPIESPPEGATCAEHGDRPAVVICPRCGSFACLSCWHGAVKRCHACVARHVPPLVPWEDPSRGVVARFFATLGDAGSPIVTAPSFRHDGTGRALVFFLLTFVPLAALSGVVPYTVHILFGPSFSIALEGHPSGQAIALDVLRAAAIGLAVALAQWLALALPFVSLSNAFAEKGHPDAPMRAMLYRGWLLPALLVARMAVPLGLPANVGEMALVLALAISWVPLLLLLVTMRATTRMGSGVSAFTAILTVAVPFTLMIGAEHFLGRGVHALLPELAEMAARHRDDAVDQGRGNVTGSPSARPDPSQPTTTNR